MNITPHTASLPLATVVNPATEGLRRENHQKEIITQVTPTNPSSAEKGVASEKDRARTSNHASEEFDFVSLKKQAEQTVTSISEQKNQQGDDQQSERQSPEDQQENAVHKVTDHENSTDDTQEEQENTKIIAELQSRDKEVKSHESAHASTGGSITGSPEYTYETGPDGKKYAVEGEVSVDLSPVAGDPQATIAKMKKVHTAALAPANPSSQDIKVAASASQQILEAQSELLILNNEDENQSGSIDNKENIPTQSTLNVANNYEQDANNDFDTFINKTLLAQEGSTSNPANAHTLTEPKSSHYIQSEEVIQRATRIESLYFSISQGYERPNNFQFELTA